MYFTSSTHVSRTSEPRRGLILMVVLALLTAFAIVGLSFVLYADAEAKSAQIAREAEQGLIVHPYDLEPKALLSNFLGQLIFDADDDTMANSALRGHSLARSMFGFNYDATTKLPVNNTTPFDGVGRIHTTVAIPVMGNQDEFNLINYKDFRAIDGAVNPQLAAFIRDPERPGARPTSGNPLKAQWLCGFNPPYTYADVNNMYLAVVDSSGNVLQPSFHRTAIFGALDAGVNANWGVSTPALAQVPDIGKYLTLRPRPKENPAFSYPEDTGGDVKNLIGNQGGNDSIWIDGGSPVRTAANGKTFKAMFAPLIVELDSRVNLSVHGNVLGNVNGTPQHISNTGWGPWSVNLSQVVKDYTNSFPAANSEWSQLFVGSSTPKFTGRYGLDKLPGFNGTPATGTFPFQAGYAGVFPSLGGRSYSQIAFDEGNASGAIRAAFGGPINPSLQPTGTNPTYFPSYPTGYETAVGTTQLNANPLAYNAFAAKANVDDRIFPLASMEALLRFNDTTSYSITGDLLNLCPNAFGQPGQQRGRSMVTSRSMDVDVPGLAPALLRSGGTYLLSSGTRPAASASAFPNASVLLPSTNANTDFKISNGVMDGRMNFQLGSAINLLSTKMDLNRPLPEYPPPTNGLMSSTDPKFLAAQQARQDFAKDIFDRLRLITGADDPQNVSGASLTPQPAKDGVRWLAQLAVNIVDFIDDDDIMTPFQWCAPGGVPEFVYGTELPRLLINEVLVQYKKPTTDPAHTLVDVWVELMNPSNGDTSLLDNGMARTSVTNGSTKFSPYQLSVCKNSSMGSAFTTLTAVANTAGIPDSNYISQTPLPPSGPTSIIQLTTVGGTTPCQVTPAEFQAFATGLVAPYNNASGAAQCCVLVGNSAAPTLSSTVTLGATPDIQSPEMSYQINRTDTLAAPTILLQRLACPYMPQSGTNPYVAVDIFQSACHDNVGFLISTGNDVTSGVAGDASDARANPFVDSLSVRASETGTLSGANIKTSFRALNSKELAGSPNQWLVHLDRYLSSPMELLHVSGFKAHELTHYFGDTTSGAMGQFNQRVPWFDEDLAPATSNSHLLYRFFELVETRSHMAGMEPVVFQTFPQSSAIAAHASAIPLQTVFGSADNGALIQISNGDILTVIGNDPSNPNQTIMENVRVASVSSSPPSITLANGTNGFTINQSFVNAYLVHTGTGGRIAGKLNINSVFDKEIFRALCDQNAANAFPATDVDTMHSSIKTAIHVGTSMPDSPAVGTWTNPLTDQPFMGMGMAQLQFSTTPPPTDLLQLTTANGAYRSYFRPVSSSNPAGLFEPASLSGASVHPFRRYELLNKTFNNITSRSNVFAVWLTVGFFECDANGNNLGQEIGKAEGRNIRHRMFAIVDRTGLAVPRLGAMLSTGVTASAKAQSVGLSSTSGITAGMQLLIVTPATNSQPARTEPVTVLQVSANQISAIFNSNHNATDSVYIMPGFWGPQPGFDVTQPVNSQIVPYYSIIE